MRGVVWCTVSLFYFTVSDFFVLICYAFHVVLCCCSLYDFNHWLHLKEISIYLTRRAAAVRFLTRTFRNVFYVGVGKRYVRLWRSQRS